MQKTQVRFLGWEDPLEKEMATHSSILAWKNLMDRGSWWAAVHGVTESGTTEQLTLTYIYLSISVSHITPPLLTPGNHKFVFFICNSIYVL